MRYWSLLSPLLALLFLLANVRPARAMFLPEDTQPGLPQTGESLVTHAPIVLMCSFTPETETLLAGTSLEDYTGWISKLSGEQPMTVDEHTITITTRNSYALFNGTYTAFDILRDQVLKWYSAEQVEEETYLYSGLTWKNLVLTIEGTQAPNDVVMLTAHFDDMPATGPAPGADDNASGSATLLEAARLLAGHSFPRTLKIVWFTGEEQGLRGSAAYALEHQQELSSVLGVINLDMYAYDYDNDHCFEMHVGTLPASNQVGECIAEAIQLYQPDLTYDYFTTSGVIYGSDHASFWSYGVGAVEIGENFSINTTTGGCGSVADRNRYYHQSLDRLEYINLSTAYPIHRSALAAFFAMAIANPYKYYFPFVTQQAP